MPEKVVFTSSFDDQAQLAALFKAAELGRREPDEIATAFQNSRYKVFALDGTHLVGAGRAFGDEVDCAVICDLAVHPDAQANGLGASMLEIIKQQVRHHLRIILYARPGKENFYQKRGFRPMRTAMLTSFIVPEADNRARGLIV